MFMYDKAKAEHSCLILLFSGSEMTRSDFNSCCSLGLARSNNFVFQLTSVRPFDADVWIGRRRRPRQSDPTEKKKWQLLWIIALHCTALIDFIYLFEIVNGVVGVHYVDETCRYSIQFRNRKMERLGEKCAVGWWGWHIIWASEWGPQWQFNETWWDIIKKERNEKKRERYSSSLVTVFKKRIQFTETDTIIIIKWRGEGAVLRHSTST